MSNDIIMYVQTENGMVELHPETIATQVKLTDGIRTLQDFLDERDFIKHSDGFLHVKTPDGKFVPVNTQTHDFPLKPASNISIESLEENVAIKWTDPGDVTIETSSGSLPLVKWAGSRLVAKEGSIPVHINDGITLVDSKVRDQYSSKAFVTSLEKGKLYYLRIFPYNTHEGYTASGDVLTVNTSDITLDDIVMNVSTVDSNIYASWSDPVDITKVFNGNMMAVNTWTKTVLVIKNGSEPSSITDGEIIIENLERDKYKVSPLVIDTVTEGIKFAKIFSIDEDGSINNSTPTVQMTVSHGTLGPVTNLNLTKEGTNVRVSWKDPVEETVVSNGLTVKTATWKKSVLVMKEGFAPSNIDDGFIVRESIVYNEYSSGGFLVENVTLGVDLHFGVFAITTNGKMSTSSSESIMIPDIPLPDVTGPGPLALVAGDNKAGFFGEVPNEQLITPLNLATSINLMAGLPQHNDTPWLKFIIDDKVIFVSKKPIRYNISWKEIDDVNAVNGKKIISIGGNIYRVRLMKGSSTDPSGTGADLGAIGSEWNRLMLPIHVQAKDQSWAFPEFTGTDIPNWNIGYTDADLLTHHKQGLGFYSWCQEVYGPNNASRILRGTHGVSYSGGYPNYSNGESLGWRPVLELIDTSQIVDKSNSPGSPALLAGDTTAGFFGEVPNTELITPLNLASTIGLTAGRAQHNDTPWLKFIIDNKVIFVAKKTIRHSISWDAINAVGAVNGTKTIDVGGNTYKVRLMKGALTDPSSSATDLGAVGSEWNRLMLPIHIQAKDQSWAYPKFAGTNVPNWDIGYTDADLLTHNSYGSGSYSWCQEVYGANTTHRVMRGSSGVSFSTAATPSSTGCGWRPVLELINPSEYDDLTTSPGSPVLLAGDSEAGFFGEVPNADLITPTALASSVNLTQGTAQFNDTPWLKFTIDGKIIFVSKKPIRHTISWDEINAVGAVDGTKIITIGNNEYKVRLMRTSLTDPAVWTDDRGAIGSEWNRLMLPIHIQAKDQSWAYPVYAGTNVPNWGIGYTDADLVTKTTHGNGSYSWCQEVVSTSPTGRSLRGSAGISYYGDNLASNAQALCGWRPVLELIPKQ